MSTGRPAKVTQFAGFRVGSGGWQHSYRRRRHRAGLSCRGRASEEGPRRSSRAVRRKPSEYGVSFEVPAGQKWTEGGTNEVAFSIRRRDSHQNRHDERESRKGARLLPAEVKDDLVSRAVAADGG